MYLRLLLLLAAACPALTPERLGHLMGMPFNFCPSQPETSVRESAHRKPDRRFRIDLSKFPTGPGCMPSPWRIAPVFENGKPHGLRFFAIRPGSPYAKLGLQDDDVVESVNGFDVSTPERALDAYSKLRKVRTFEVKLERRGQTLHYRYELQ